MCWITGEHSRRMLKKARLLTRPTPAVISPAHPESARQTLRPGTCLVPSKAAANYHFIRGGWDDPNCTQWTSAPPTKGVDFSAIRAWTFDVKMNNGSLLTGPLASSIRVRYGNNGSNAPANPNTVENITLQAVPEPASLLLLGAGLVGIGIWRWKSVRM